MNHRILTNALQLTDLQKYINLPSAHFFTDNYQGKLILFLRYRKLNNHDMMIRLIQVDLYRPNPEGHTR